MPRFLTGDELGNIKSVSYDPESSSSLLKTLHDGTSTGRTRGIHKLTVARDNPTLLASAHANGAICLASLTDGDALERACEWKETRFDRGHAFVGLALTQGTAYACTSNGALRRTTIGNESLAHDLAALPSRLMDWRLSPNQETFAYGGDEVEVSIWDTKRAFQSQPDNAAATSNSKKRKRTESLFPSETWRAKNVANDHLGLRQPVHNTCLTYMPSPSQPQIVAGTRFGDLRRYDTRAGRRPVTDFKGVGKVGGVKSVEMGLSEHQVFLSDQGTNLSALDLRTGGTTYGYKGISGAVNSLAVSPSFLASVSLDRFIRIHSICPPATDSGKHQEERGHVLDKVYMTTIPTAVAWDQSTAGSGQTKAGDDIWGEMELVGEGTENERLK